MIKILGKPMFLWVIGTLLGLMGFLSVVKRRIFQVRSKNLERIYRIKQKYTLSQALLKRSRYEFFDMHCSQRLYKKKLLKFIEDHLRTFPEALEAIYALGRNYSPDHPASESSIVIFNSLRGGSTPASVVVKDVLSLFEVERKIFDVKITLEEERTGTIVQGDDIYFFCLVWRICYDLFETVQTKTELKIDLSIREGVFCITFFGLFSPPLFINMVELERVGVTLESEEREGKKALYVRMPLDFMKLQNMKNKKQESNVIDFSTYRRDREKDPC